MNSDDRVFDGEIKEGLRKYYLRPQSELTVEVVKEKRMHSFRMGYRPTGRPMPLTEGLNKREARAVRDLLDYWLEENE